MSVQANCPACGAPVTFRVGTSLVTVCSYCQSVIGRGDRGLESLGKVADLAQTQSPLDLYIKGRWHNVPFDLVGRTQYLHPAGGVWDEWYLAFADGRWGWLAEAQGRFLLTFEMPTSRPLPPYESLQLGQQFDVGEGLRLTVAEKNRARVGSAQGEIPMRFTPGQEFLFADLSGPQGEFGTLDYRESTPTLYVGREVTLDELHIPPGVRRTYPGQEPRIQAVALNCPRCAAALTLHAPDRSERVGCPSCGSLLDVREGQLQLLRSLNPPILQPALPLGAIARNEGVQWTVLGFLDRYVTFEGTDYHWQEYLLYQPRLGFRWLTCSDDQWNWVEPLPPGTVQVDGHTAYYADRWYRLFQRAKARVALVYGEFYWKVQAGETVVSRDYVRAPQMLSEEVSQGDDAGEVSWSLAHYKTPEEVEAMFGQAVRLPRPTGIAPNQPFPYTGIYRWLVCFVAVALLLGVILWAISPRSEVLTRRDSLQPLPTGVRNHKILVEEPLQLQGWRNVRILVRADSASGWMHVSGTLTAVQPSPTPGTPQRAVSPLRRSFSLLATGSDSAYVTLSAVPAGAYHLQYDLSPQNPLLPGSVTVRVEQGVPEGSLLVVVLLLLIVLPVAVGLYQLYFETARWQDSNVD